MYTGSQISEMTLPKRNSFWLGKNFLLLLDFLVDPRLRSRVPAKSLGDQIQNKRLTEKEEGKLSIEKNRSQALALKLAVVMLLGDLPS